MQLLPRRGFSFSFALQKNEAAIRDIENTWREGEWMFLSFGGSILPMSVEKPSFKQSSIEGPLETAVEKAMRGEIAWEKEAEETLPLYDKEASTINDELWNIKGAPKEYRELLMHRLKERLNRRIEGIAEIQDAVMSAIRKNPEIPKEDLVKAIKNSGSRYGMTNEQKELAEHLVDLYELKHARVREIREEYPNDRDLFRVLFGKNPAGKIEIVEGPMTLYVRCADIDDYALIHSQKFLKGETVQAADREIAGKSTGSHISTSLISGLEGTITAENSGPAGFMEKGFIDSENTHRHEEQHAVWEIFNHEIEMLLIDERLENAAATDVEKELALKNLLKFGRQGIDYRTSNEILAYCIGGRDPGEIYASLTQRAAEGGLYEYFDDRERSETKQWVRKSLPNKLGKTPEDFEKLLDKAVEEVYVDEYRKLIKSGIESFEKLVAWGYSKEKAVSVLIHEPLSRWAKVVNRLTGKNS